jgi:beta-glucosidase
VLTLSFPAGFLWGAATSSYQIEGAVHEGGRGESIWDRFCARPGAIADGSSGEVACDHHGRWLEDVALMRELGLPAYRFSIAWPRVAPDGRCIEPRGLDFYDRLVDGLLAAGIEPWATLYHWDLPQALEDRGGWTVRATARAFVDYADAVARRLGDRVKGWITHNEPWCAAMLGYRDGVHAPGRREWPAALAAAHHLLLSHGWAVPVVRHHCPRVPVGITLNLAPVHAASGSVFDRDARRWLDGNFNRWFLDPLYGRGWPDDMVRDYVRDGALPSASPPWQESGDLDAISTQTDFLGVNYYYRHFARSDRVPDDRNAPPTIVRAPRSTWTEMDWEVYPEGLWELLVRLHLEYAPAKLYVTESGASWSDGPDEDGRIRDDRRIEYLREHFVQAHRALVDGVPLAGYFVWSLLDNFEWQHGYAQRFGIVWVDAGTQRRRLKDSALFLREVVAKNAVGPAVAG